MQRPAWPQPTDGGAELPCHGDAFDMAISPVTSSSSASSSTHSTPFLWADYPLATNKRIPAPSAASFANGRRQSLLSSQMMKPEDDDELELTMDDSALEVDMVDADPDTAEPEPPRPLLAERPRWMRHSHSSSASSVVGAAVSRQTSSPSSDVDRTFNPLNPQALPTATTTTRRQRESSGESVMMADSPGATMAPLPPMPTPPQSPSLGSGPGTLQRARSSPSLMFGGSAFSSFVQPTTPPPPLTQRRFSSQDDLPLRDKSVASPGTNLSVSPNSRTGVVRRPVTGRRQNLMPKPKAHLRVQMQLQDEGPAGPLDLDIASEAALHRINRSAASLSPRTPMSAASLQNRFPESIDGDEDDRGDRDSSGSDNDAVVSVSGSVSADAAGPMLDEEMGRQPSPVGAIAIAEAEEKRRQTWLWGSFRERVPASQSPGGQSAYGRSMDVDGFSPGTSGWAGTSRPNKRKMGADAHSDRFEPYNSMAFKRRAVSPTASLQNGSNNTGASTPVLGSPVLGFACAPALSIPPLSPTSAGLGLGHAAFFQSVSGGPVPPVARGSRATSPAVAASTPARGALGIVLSGARAAQQQEATMRNDEELSARAFDSLSGMHIG